MEENARFLWSGYFSLKNKEDIMITWNNLDTLERDSHIQYTVFHAVKQVCDTACDNTRIFCQDGFSAFYGHALPPSW